MTIVPDELTYFIPNYLPLKDFQKEGEKFVIELGGGELFKKLKLDEIATKTLKKFLTPYKLSQIVTETDLEPDVVLKFCNHLINEKIIVPYKETPDDYKRYDRHLQYYGLNNLCPIKAQDTLKDITITLIGAGGIGNWIGLNLVGLGIKKIRLVDSDVIEKSNLTRQVMFSELDVGKLKVEVAAKQLQQRNESLIVETIASMVSEKNVLEIIQDSNFVVLSADRPFFAIQKWLNDGCLKLKIPLLNVGYAAGEGLMGPLVIPGKSSCLACNGYIDENNYYLNNKNNDAEAFSEHFISPSFSCLNSLISSIASYEIVKFLLGFGECISINNAVRINPLDFSIIKIPCERNNACKACQIV
jgi:molybdopterin-synthase adenylyltransferase